MKNSHGGRFIAMCICCLSAISPSANAAYICSGKIDSLGQPHDGSVLLTSTQIYGDTVARQICNLKLTWNGVDPVVCRGWLTALLAAKTAASPIALQYNDSKTACSQQPAFGYAGFPWSI